MFKFIFLFLLSFNAFAFDEWSTKDKTLESIFVAATTVDWLQTRNITRHNCTEPNTGSHDCTETNVLLGEHPTTGQVNTYFAALIISHIAIVNAIPSKYRTPFQSGSIVIEVGCAYNNYKIGISSKF